MTFSREDPRGKITFRASSELRADLDEHAEAEGTTKSEVVRTAIRNHIADDSPEIGITPPNDERLAEAWTYLNELAGETPYIDQQTAKSCLASRFNVPKTAAQQTLLRPLIDRGYVTPVSNWDGTDQSLRLRRRY